MSYRHFKMNYKSLTPENLGSKTNSINKLLCDPGMSHRG